MNIRISLLLRYVFLLLSFILLHPGRGSSQNNDKELSGEEALRMWLDTLDKIDKSIPYKTGRVEINEQIGLNIPAGYKFIPQQEARLIVSDLWGNPQDDGVLGMIVSVDYKLADLDGWAFIVSYDESGYVKDEDAESIDYTAMLKDIQKDEAGVNAERAKLGYESMHLLGWAAQPYYDKERKILHWAKKMQFGEEVLSPEELTLNYDVRILGRKGILSLNAVGTMDQLELINRHIPDVLGIASFNDGFAYSDFNPSVDKVAAYTVGGLVAGKLLAKSGILVLLLKNIKLILIAAAGVLALFRKKIAGLFGSKPAQNSYTEMPDTTAGQDESGTDAYAAFNSSSATLAENEPQDEDLKNTTR